MTKTTVKQISTVAPEYVTEAVKNFTETHRMRNISFNMIADGGTLYLDEDARYTFFLPNGEQKSISMGGEWGGYKRGIEGAIGGRMPMPAGSWAVESGFFLGKPTLTVHHWGLAALPA